MAPHASALRGRSLPDPAHRRVINVSHWKRLSSSPAALYGVVRAPQGCCSGLPSSTDVFSSSNFKDKNKGFICK
ncbi:unnamed protein product [Leuciscus chuanchicus]